MSRGAPDRRTRVVIAEDQTLMAEGLRKLLETEFQSVTVVGNGQELLDTAPVLKPDVVLVDILLPPLNGIEATRCLGNLTSATRVVIVTAHNDPQYVVEAFRAGATGFVLKRCAFSELVIAIRRVLAGQTYVTPLVAGQAFDSLTSRQREVLRLVSVGCTAKEIARALKLSVKTVVCHKTALMKKLELHTTAELTRYALEHGIGTTNLPPSDKKHDQQPELIVV